MTDGGFWPPIPIRYGWWGIWYKPIRNGWVFTDRVFELPIPSVTDDGWGVSLKPRRKTVLLTDLLGGKQDWKCPFPLLSTCCGSKSLKVILIDSDLTLITLIFCVKMYRWGEVYVEKTLVTTTRLGQSVVWMGQGTALWNRDTTWSHRHTFSRKIIQTSL